jgi:hypothetical protein
MMQQHREVVIIDEGPTVAQVIDVACKGLIERLYND